MRKTVSLAVVDQAVLSLFNLGLNLALISLASPEEFGRFIYALAVILILTSVQNALIATPASVLLPTRTGDAHLRTLRELTSFDLWFRIGAAALGVAICALVDRGVDFLISAAAATFMTLARETIRMLYIATDRVMRCLQTDVVAVVAAIGATIVLWQVLRPPVAVLAGLATGNLIAGLVFSRGLIPARLWPRQALLAYRAYWPDTRWALTGASTTEIQNRFYVFVVEGIQGAAALASVQAGRLLLGPLTLLASSWCRVARPEMARRLAREDYAGTLRLALRGAAFVLGVGLAWCLALYVAWPLAEQYVFKGRYPDAALMTIAWAICALIAVTQISLSVVLQAAYRLRELALVTVGVACLSSALLFGLAFGLPPLHAVIAVTAGEVLALAWIIILLVRLFRERPARSLSANGPSTASPSSTARSAAIPEGIPRGSAGSPSL